MARGFRPLEWHFFADGTAFNNLRNSFQEAIVSFACPSQSRFAPRGRIEFADVSDGTSNTDLVGEKYLNPDAYTVDVHLRQVVFSWLSN